MVQTPTCSEFQMAATGGCVVDWMCLFQHPSHVVDLMGLLQLYNFDTLPSKCPWSFKLKTKGSWVLHAQAKALFEAHSCKGYYVETASGSSGANDKILCLAMDSSMPAIEPGNGELVWPVQ
jgi:hypothetical protein